MTQPRNYGYNNNPYVSYSDRGVAWREGGAERWARNNRIDERGFLQGDFPYVPQELALPYQAIHDQRVYQYRDRVMRDAITESRAGNRLMQSYRPGGSAAIQANMHGQTAALQMQRAGLMQPMDLMSDYRRHVRATQQKRRQFAFEMQLYAGIGGAIASYWLPQYAGISQSLLSGAAESYEGATAAIAGDQPTASGGGSTGSQTFNVTAEPSKKTKESPQTASTWLQNTGGEMMPVGGSSGGGVSGFAGGAMGSTVEPETPGGHAGGGSALRGAPAGGGGSGGGGGGSGGGGSGGAGAAGGGGYASLRGAGDDLRSAQSANVPGVDGDFTSTRRAAYAAQRTPYVDTYLSSAMVERYENDPFYDELEAEIDYQMMLRRTG